MSRSAITEENPMAKNQDHLTTDGEPLRPGPAPTLPRADGPPVEAIDDGPAEPAPGRQPTEPKAKGNEDKPTLRISSPGNERRAEIMKIKRSDLEAGQDRLEDVIGKENVNTARYGKAVADKMEAEETLAEADATGVPATPAEPASKPRTPAPQAVEAEKLHGNRVVEIKVNRKLIPVAMRELRAVLAENDIDPTDMPDNVVIKSAQTLLAAHDRLKQAKQGHDVDAEEGEPEAPPQKQFSVKETLKRAMEEQMYGDPDKAADIMAEAVTQMAAGATAHLMESRDIQQGRHTVDSQMSDVQLEYERTPQWQQMVKSQGRAKVNSVVGYEAVGYLIEELEKHLDPAAGIDLADPDTRGSVYVDLRRRGVPLPSEADIVRQAHKRALQLYGPSASVNPKQPTVNLSGDRMARRDAVSTQPRAANAAANPIAQPRSRSDVVLEMQRARPR